MPFLSLPKISISPRISNIEYLSTFAFENSSTLTHSPERNGRQSHASETSRGEARRSWKNWKHEDARNFGSDDPPKHWTRGLGDGWKSRWSGRAASRGARGGGREGWRTFQRSRTHTNSVQLRVAGLRTRGRKWSGGRSSTAGCNPLRSRTRARKLDPPIARNGHRPLATCKKKEGKKRDFKNGRDSISDGG